MEANYPYALKNQLRAAVHVHDLWVRIREKYQRLPCVQLFLIAGESELVLGTGGSRIVDQLEFLHQMFSLPFQFQEAVLKSYNSQYSLSPLLWPGFPNSRLSAVPDLSAHKVTRGPPRQSFPAQHSENKTCRGSFWQQNWNWNLATLFSTRDSLNFLSFPPSFPARSHLSRK